MCTDTSIGAIGSEVRADTSIGAIGGEVRADPSIGAIGEDVRAKTSIGAIGEKEFADTSIGAIGGVERADTSIGEIAENVRALDEGGSGAGVLADSGNGSNSGSRRAVGRESGLQVWRAGLRVTVSRSGRAVCRR